MNLVLLLTCVLAADPTPEQFELLKTLRAEFVAIHPGSGQFPKTFRMGSERGDKSEQPVHPVTFGYPFSIAKYEVPQNLWAAVMGSNPSRWKGVRNSAEMINFAEAGDFCARTTQLMRAAKLISSDEIIRLPTEAEWEYTTRAGTDTLYSFGDQRFQLFNYGWSTENAAGNDPAVGAKLPNPWGLYDVHGYLWEWCLDPWHPDYSDAPQDGSAWSKGGDAAKAVARGGSWKETADKLTSSARKAFPRDTRDDALGLRCVLVKSR